MKNSFTQKYEMTPIHYMSLLKFIGYQIGEEGRRYFIIIIILKKIPMIK